MILAGQRVCVVLLNGKKWVESSGVDTEFGIVTRDDDFERIYGFALKDEADGYVEVSFGGVQKYLLSTKKPG